MKADSAMTNQGGEREVKRFRDKVVLVTGGSRNTGLEIVSLFLEEGARVFFCGSTDESTRRGCDELARRGYGGFIGIPCDIGRKEDVATMFDVVERAAGRLDVLVSNAASLGIGHGTSIEMSEEKFLDTLNTNMGGFFRLVQGATNRFFLKQECDTYTGQRGIVVCIGTNTSERASRKRLAYLASKGGLDAMVRSFATDLGPMGVRVNMLAPGYIRTDRWNWLPEEVKARRRSNTITGRECDGRDVAEGVAFLASPGARTFQGARLVMDSGSSVQLYPECCEDDTSNMRQK